MKDIMEKLADQEHEQWSNWMKYLFTKGVENEDGTFTINAESVKRWKRQLETPYELLSEEEKESDRELAKIALGIVAKDIIKVLFGGDEEDGTILT